MAVTLKKVDRKFVTLLYTGTEMKHIYMYLSIYKAVKNSHTYSRR